MSVAFDTFIDAFLNKITSYDYVNMEEDAFYNQVYRFLFGACSDFEMVFWRRTGLSFSDRDEASQCFNWDLSLKRYLTDYRADCVTLDEVVDIVSEGMVLRWLKSFLFSGDSLDLGNFLQTKDFIPYSPSNFLSSLRGLYNETQDNYRRLLNDFSYNHGELNTLHM